jgi:hypothetical protein
MAFFLTHISSGQKKSLALGKGWVLQSQEALERDVIIHVIKSRFARI